MCVTAIVALIAVRLAARPADAALPYGYGKAEYFSAVVIGVFIAVAALLIFSEGLARASWRRCRCRADPIGLGVSAAATVLNALWAWYLIRTGTRERSPSLMADGRHLATDVVSTVGVLIGVLLVIVTGYHAARCDPRGTGGHCDPVVGLAADPRERDRADGRGGRAGDAEADPRDHCGQCRRGDRGA